MALVASTPVWFEEFIKIFRSVIVREFFAGLDVFDGIDLDLASDDTRFAVWPAGVVDVTGGVVMFLAVDRPFRINIEEIASAPSIGLFVGYFFAGIFDDECSLVDRLGCKQAKSCAGSCALDGVWLFGCCRFAAHGV